MASLLTGTGKFFVRYDRMRQHASVIFQNPESFRGMASFSSRLEPDRSNFKCFFFAQFLFWERLGSILPAPDPDEQSACRSPWKSHGAGEARSGMACASK